MARGIYVEIGIDGSLDEVWNKTQSPQLHEQWDLRFTSIEYLPRHDPSQPQRFLYSTQIGFGLNIQGEGETVGSREAENGHRTSALKFWSDDPKSLIREGAGYWKYIPRQNDVRFLTWYDYRTRFGALGRAFDAVIFRPLIGWATAWSFDRLRLWIEKGINPASSLRNSLIHAVARVTLAFVWLYHGLIPKLIFRHKDELEMLTDAGISQASLPLIVNLIGWVEVAVGLSLLLLWHARWLFPINIALMLLALFTIAFNSPAYLVAAFNPLTLNAAIIALSLIGFISSAELPSARRCLRRKRAEDET